MTTHRLTLFRLAILVLAAGVLLGAPAAALAQPAAAAQSQPPAIGQGDFVPARDLPAQETIPAAPIVMAAYAFVWAALLVYVWTVWRRLLKVEREVKDLAGRLTAKPGPRK